MNGGEGDGERGVDVLYETDGRLHQFALKGGLTGAPLDGVGVAGTTADALDLHLNRKRLDVFDD